jgi:hypothetical protein
MGMRIVLLSICAAICLASAAKAEVACGTNCDVACQKKRGCDDETHQSHHGHPAHERRKETEEKEWERRAVEEAVRKEAVRRAVEEAVRRAGRAR